MDLKELKALVRLMEGGDLEELEVAEGDDTSYQEAATTLDLLQSGAVLGVAKDW